VLASHAAVLQGRVVKVVDGDTITVLDESHVQHKIRLSGIDAPEKKQAFGWRSKHTLGLLVFGRQVLVQTTKKDKYGRWVGKVLLDNSDVNLAQLEAGMAWHYKKYENEQSGADRLDYAAAQIMAQVQRRGLWQDPKPLAPWDFRQKR
jgi:endonuclease YncB( thermonuclease family)